MRLSVGGTMSLALAVTLAACSSSTPGTSPTTGATGSTGTAGAPLTIALVCSCTGLAASEYQGVVGALQARVDVQNAMGGANGHKINVLTYDDATSPAQNPTAVQNAISRGVVGIVSVSALFFAGAKYAHQANIPVTGSSSDGPEWGTQPYTNMFASDTGSVDPKYPVTTQIGQFLVSHGGSVVGSYGYNVSPSSTRSATSTAQATIHAGGKQGVLDTSVAFGSVDFTAAALVAKANHVTGVYGAMLNDSNFALATAMKQGGVDVKAMVFPTGYAPGAITSPAWPNLQGAYFASEFRPFSLPNAGTVEMASALQKYDNYSKSQFPTFAEYESWLGADLMIKGIQLAGSDPSSANIIKALRNIKSYDGNGILPGPIDYSTIFGHNLQPSCGWFLQAQAHGFVPVTTQSTCGRDIPGTTTVVGG